MSFKDIVFAITGAFGWLIIGLAVLALVYVTVGYLRLARDIVRREGWGELWQQIRKNALTRPPRHRP